MKKVKLKPTAERIDSNLPRKEIIYRCSKCNTSFATLGQKIKYCYGCGTEVDWNVKTRLDEEFDWMWVQFANKSKSSLSCDDYEELYIKELNNKQKRENK